ncbi:MAG: ATP-binding protein [Bacteroidia bacterium]|nr:ATP-binding protein [Bacteroidia bacterium]
MKKRLLHICFSLVLILCTSFSVFAQIDPAEAKDKAKNAEGLERLQAMIDMSEHYKQSNPRQSLSYAQEALRFAQTLKTKNILEAEGFLYDPQTINERRVDAFILSGLAYKSQKRRSRALKNLRDGQKLAESINYPAGENRVKSILSEMNAASGINNVLDNAISKVEKWVDGNTGEVSSKIKKDAAARGAQINENTAKRAEDNGDYERAIEYYEKSIRSYISIGDSAKSEALSQHVAMLYNKIGEAKEPEEIIAFTESAKKVEEENNPNAEIDDFVEDLKTISEASKPDPILSIVEEETEQKTKTVLREAQSLMAAGRNREAEKKYGEALRLQAVLLQYKSERQMDSLTSEFFIELMLDERDIFEQEAEDSRKDRNFLILITFLFLSIAALSAWLFFIKRKSHREMSRAYDELEETHQELKSTQTQLVAAEKMASLGQLTAGIAHEINNPVNFISGNIHPLKSDISELLKLLNAYENIVQAQGLNEKFSDVSKMKHQMDFEYLKEEISELLEGMAEGAHRTTEIVKGLRMFARVDEEQPKPLNIHLGLDNTLALLKSQLKDVELIKDYGDIPVIEGFPGKINQVFMNVLTNAIQAMPSGGWIRIKTRRVGGQVEVRIQDTGDGIPKETVDKIFEPFFTTKSLGEGTGLGLSISLGIMKQHGGFIDIESDPGHGTEVILSLPLQQETSYSS